MGLKMKIVYARESLPTSIFLAGPTPRDPETKSWRPEAIELLKKYDFQGTVYVPENRDQVAKFDYDDQINWEWNALESSTTIIFWVPREMKSMPALTTNVEFGLYVRSGRVLLGYPLTAEKNKYLDALASRFSVPVYHDLEDLICSALCNPFTGQKRT